MKNQNCIFFLINKNRNGRELPVTTQDTKTPRPNVRNSVANLFNSIWWTVFLLTFFAEWGDPSQLSTIAFSATANISGVIIGGIIGHALCTILAQICGTLLASRVSERTMGFIGGGMFLFFALQTLIMIHKGHHGVFKISE